MPHLKIAPNVEITLGFSEEDDNNRFRLHTSSRLSSGIWLIILSVWLKNVSICYRDLNDADMNLYCRKDGMAIPINNIERTIRHFSRMIYENSIADGTTMIMR